jgi:hypothetical protein
MRITLPLPRAEYHQERGDDDEKRPQFAPRISLKISKVIEKEENSHHEHIHAWNNTAIPSVASAPVVTFIFLFFSHLLILCLIQGKSIDRRRTTHRMRREGIR